ncbi:MAG: 16S rRNA (cytosine(967)-C(5))-methyltransferase RsmB [Clostridiales bacterium]|nr:16S rRNA (cytosine(967)-C(5))-methyltransferase RsmB [Clostridiales bacterium]
MKKHILGAYRILSGVYADGTYSNMALNGDSVTDMSTKLVYGVLENDVKTEYIINSLVDKKPQRAVSVLLKIGVYALLNLTDVPQFAIVSECVEAAKSIGKGGAGGFINAVLKKVARGEYKLPDESSEDYLSVTYSKPRWFVDKLIAQYGRKTAVEILSAQSEHLEHIRVNGRLSSVGEVTKKLERAKESYTLSEVGGIIARGTDSVKRMFDDGLVTYQSPSSMLAVQALAPKDGSQILDLCSAPGGKAVYISELCPHSTVYAGELHPHRISLIQKYKNRMHVPNVKAVQLDATKLKDEWVEKFDFVLVDAPCSCFGTFLKHPDVFLSRGEGDILSLQATQKLILANAAKYLKRGGVLVYSTCTLFEEENGEVVDSLLSSDKFRLEHISAVDKIDGGKHKDNDGRVQILPHGEYDGFYIARLMKE